jgi:hypothetical protein
MKLGFIHDLFYQTHASPACPQGFTDYQKES